MKLVVITQSQKSDTEILAIIQMFEAGLETLHVRKNRFSTKELDDYIKEIPAHFHNRIIIHSHHKLALKYDLKGFHFTSTHIKHNIKLWWNTKMIYLRKPHLVKSISYKRIAQLYEEQKVKTDYCFLGTMFHNISGELYSGFYPETVTAAIEKSGKKIYARGGVNEKSAELAYKLGFHGIALYGHLWKSTSPFEKYIAFVRYCKEKKYPYRIMVFWDWIALLTGIAGVLLTIFQSIWCWPMALISVVISGTAFYNQRLFGDFGLQIFYFISGIYGWLYWNKKKGKVFTVTKMPSKYYAPVILSIIIQTIVYYYLLHYFKSDQILFDAILTSCSFTCTFMMAKKWVENWMLWIIIDAAYVFLYVIKDLPTYALLYGFFSLMAYYGFYSWKKQLIKE